MPLTVKNIIAPFTLGHDGSQQFSIRNVAASRFPDTNRREDSVRRSSLLVEADELLTCTATHLPFSFASETTLALPAGGKRWEKHPRNDI